MNGTIGIMRSVRERNKIDCFKNIREETTINAKVGVGNIGNDMEKL
jgi:hypothetical protein